MLKINAIKCIFLICIMSSSVNVSGQDFEIPKGLFLVSFSNAESQDSSSILGAELQLNLKLPESSFAFGFHGSYQGQTFSVVDTSRWGLGLSGNYYTNFGYIGIKSITYLGGGTKEEALDCLYCSDIEEDYSGGEIFLSVGSIYNGWVIQIDKRITDNRSQWSETAYDPYGVGVSYNNSLTIPDPKYIFHIGHSF